MNIKSVCKYGHPREAGSGKPCPTCAAKRHKEWNKNHPHVGRKAAANWRAKNPDGVIKANNHPERRWRRIFNRYGITKAEFYGMLERQHGKCLGCLVDVTDKTANIDHKHDESGKVRGLLCRECNWALGMVHESPATLRRLMAYLDYDRSKTHIYLIGALKNKRVPEVGNLLRKSGYDVMDEWFTPGEFADSNWQEYEKQRGRTYSEALRGRAATNIFLFDRSYLDLSDIVILVSPAGKSAMIELGYAKGRGKKTIIFLDGQDPDRYDMMPNFADDVVFSEQELLDKLLSL